MLMMWWVTFGGTPFALGLALPSALIFCTTLNPEVTCPKRVYEGGSGELVPAMMKNWLPLELGEPEFAIATAPTG